MQKKKIKTLETTCFSFESVVTRKIKYGNKFGIRPSKLRLRQVFMYYVNDVFVLLLQLRRQARQRREYLYRKGVEERQRQIQDKKDRLKNAVQGN